MAKRRDIHTWIKPVVFFLFSFPFLLLLSQWVLLATGQPSEVLGANPIDKTVLETGEFAIRALLASLAISPLARLFSNVNILRYRRMLGLFAFFYGTLHLFAYVGMDQLFSLSALWEDLTKRWYITLGMLAWLVMLPMAITSTQKMVRRLGSKRWKNLHKLIYIVAISAVVHNIFMVKGWQVQPLVNAAILALLLGYRAVGSPRLRQAAPA